MATRGKLLIIEDDVDLVRALEHYFSRADFDVLSALDGREGLQKLYDERPDLVILDIAIPRLDGWQVLQRIRELSDVPIVVLTARIREEERVKGLKLGADDYVVKPFSLKELEAPTELRLLLYLAENTGRVLTHEQILGKIWGPDYSENADYVKLFVYRLRRKIELDPKHPRYLITERGLGYRFVRPVE
jgi:DNA-binding response OmpR family regulator